MRDHAQPKHNAIAGKWLQFPKSKIDFSDWFNVRNAQSLRLELSNLVRGIEHDLEMARAFKELEPAEEPPFEADEAINNLHFLHSRKMEALDRAVYELIKVQDLSSARTWRKDWRQRAPRAPYRSRISMLSAPH
jgi:hypothetical protein